MISDEDVKHLGWLSRVELEKEDSEKFARELDRILDYFTILDAVDLLNMVGQLMLVSIASRTIADSNLVSIKPSSNPTAVTAIIIESLDERSIPAKMLSLSV